MWRYFFQHLWKINYSKVKKFVLNYVFRGISYLNFEISKHLFASLFKNTVKRDTIYYIYVFLFSSFACPFWSPLFWGCLDLHNYSWRISFFVIVINTHKIKFVISSYVEVYTYMALSAFTSYNQHHYFQNFFISPNRNCINNRLPQLFPFLRSQ